MVNLYNKILPFKGFTAMCIFPFVFIRKDTCCVNDTVIYHEEIHGCQQKEILCVSFVWLAIFSLIVGVFSPLWITVSPLVYFALYGLEYVVRLILYRFNYNEAYRNISFEQEAYLNQTNKAYIKKRRLLTSFKYLFKKTYHK